MLPGALIGLLLAACLRPTPALAAKKPSPSSYFKICKRSNPKFSECIKESIIEAKDRLVSGIPELDLVTMDPLYLPQVDMGERGFTFLLKNTSFTGLRNFKLLDVSVNGDLTQMNMSMVTPEIVIDSHYEMAGKIINFPIKGEGQAIMNFTEVSTDSYAILETYKRNGKDFIRIKSLKWIISPGNVASHFTGLFNGDKALGDAANKFFNDNWRETFSTFRNIPQNIFGVLIRDLGNRVFKQYPQDAWFPK